jgi:hypothetical protein
MSAVMNLRVLAPRSFWSYSSVPYCVLPGTSMRIKPTVSLFQSVEVSQALKCDQIL